MSSIEKALQWVGSSLENCPVRDGLTFYYQSEKIFKVLNRKKSWHIEFNIAVPEREGLIVVSDEEAKRKKLGKTRWIYKGNSDEVAKELIEIAINSIPKPRHIEPALTRETRSITKQTCPCLKRVRQIQENPMLSEDLQSEVKEAYDILQMGDYCDFTHKLFPIFQHVVDKILIKEGINTDIEIDEKIELLTKKKIMPQMLGQELQSFIKRKVFECEFAEQVRAYPIALMLVTITNRLLKATS